MTERLLMFDLNMVQMKTYVVTKMIRKEFLQPLVDDRLSTFHIKTALLFTVERFPEGIWRDDNLVQCVLYCLNTLKRFLKKRYCPHYTIDSVNLFAEKLQVNEINIVKDKVTEMIHSGLSFLRRLKIENVGERLSTGYEQFKINKVPVPEMELGIIQDMIKLLYYFRTNEDVEERKTSALAIQSAVLTENVYRDELTFMLHSRYSIIASHEASDCIGKGTEVTRDIINRYEASFSSHNPVNLLRYASMLVCTKQFELVIGVLDEIETALTPLTPTVVEESYFQQEVKDTLASVDDYDKLEPSFLLMTFAAIVWAPLYFVTGEINCVPKHLIYTKFRAITEDEIKGLNSSEVHYNIEIVFKSDLKPFFYYLRYLSSRNKSDKQKALENLSEYCKRKLKYKVSDHLESALNMLGHALELENRIPEAWRIYRQSVTIKSKYNAAYWHLFRIIGQCVYCTFK
ncbi:hypothetical protein DPMN_143195 [Dreissena polymorpha]|uniref:Mab-21-like HhH/H2TH-like domain-containing protein n=2 Tax=Dreissena polymorpha TaxID=45954 RepID=A0A9D4GCM8_DREPO|nr:hypothetical protein DPMN_143195 [Dreissena polymorpha]